MSTAYMVPSATLEHYMQAIDRISSCRIRFRWETPPFRPRLMPPFFFCTEKNTVHIAPPLAEEPSRPHQSKSRIYLQYLHAPR